MWRPRVQTKLPLGMLFDRNQFGEVLLWALGALRHPNGANIGSRNVDVASKGLQKSFSLGLWTVFRLIFGAIGQPNGANVASHARE